ncbi:MAG: DUF4365 domain-containing protein [Candidatus Tenebribacter burtonii]|nr:DUF4365 domain-containing protein [Candidatus Tenebribacter burtonii]
MKRPVQHIIENKSKKLFNDIVPDEWVSRELGDDYGYDYLIEIFDNYKSTGKTFYVQLKGSSQKILKNTIQIQIDKDNLEYFNKSLLPVLLVFCSSTTNQVWAVWANELINTMKFKPDQSSKLIKLVGKNLINSKFFYDLSDIFTIDITKKINVFSNFDNDECKQYDDKLSQYLTHFYDEQIIFNNHTLPKSLIISYKLLKKKMEISISFNQINRKIDIHFQNEFETLYKPIIKFNQIEEEFKELLATISIILIEANTASSLEILKSTIDEFSISDYSFSDLLNVGHVAIDKQEFYKYQALIEETIKKNKIDTYQCLNIAYILHGTKEDSLINNYQENILKAIDSLDDNMTKGLQYYNIANSYGISNQHKKAIKCYFLARKYNPFYTETHYWWKELGSQFFCAGHYKFAEQFYRKYLQIIKNNPDLMNPIIYALIGDCLFYQCRFALAKKEFNIFFKKTEIYLSEWYLKIHICDFFINNKLNNIKIDKSKSDSYAKKAFIEIENKDYDKAFEYLIDSINSNPSNNYAWFNFAFIMNQKGELWEAQNAYLIAALFADWDEESWINSLFMAFELKKDILFHEIASTIHRKYGDEIKQDLSDFIFKQDQWNLAERKKMYNAFIKMLDTFNDEDNRSKNKK